MHTPKTRLTIVSPALRAANNGNWRTAHRWSRMLRPRFAVQVESDWAAPMSGDCLIALHARRSAESIARHAERHPERPRIVVLTGTDLYRDLPEDPLARRSLELATRLVVLQDAAVEELDDSFRTKCRVIYQSARRLPPGIPRKRSFDVVMVGHMRAEKDPGTPMRAVSRLPQHSKVRLLHIGDALTEDYANAARELMARTPRYRWLGSRTHAETRRWIRDASVMVISSVMEGGANVVVEAVMSGVPVLASRISGNIGMLGARYDGYFPVGDDDALARAMQRVSDDSEFLAHLRRQCAERAPLFEPVREAADLNRLVDEALTTCELRGSGRRNRTLPQQDNSSQGQETQ